MDLDWVAVFLLVLAVVGAFAALWAARSGER
jgi:hypothetical protein